MSKTETLSPDDLPYRQGVGVVLFNSAGLVFCGERQDTPGAWQMPQGGIDIKHDEKPATAALRELEEEIGTSRAHIIATSQKLHHYEFPDYKDRKHAPFKGKYRGQQQRWFALLFDGSDAEIDLTRHDEVEFSRWKWVELAELPRLIVPFKRPVYEDLVKEFSALPEKIRTGKLKPLSATLTL